MIAGVMGDLAPSSTNKNLRRITSGIRAAQNAGPWTGRPPRGFQVENKRLHVDAAEFLETREALARVARGETKATVVEETGIPRSTLDRLYENRRDLYLGATADDDRVDAALDEVRPLDDLEPREGEGVESQIRRIAREELEALQEANE